MGEIHFRNFLPQVVAFILAHIDAHALRYPNDFQVWLISFWFDDSANSFFDVFKLLLSLAVLYLHDLRRDLMLDWSQYFADLVVMLLCLYCWWRLSLLLVCVRVLTVNVFGVTVWALEVLLHWTNFRFNNKSLLSAEIVCHIHWLDFQNVAYPLILRSLFVLFLVPFFECFKGKFLNLTVWILG